MSTALPVPFATQLPDEIAQQRHPEGTKAFADFLNLCDPVQLKAPEIHAQAAEGQQQ